MTSSKRHRGQRAVSHLVLYSNLKKKTKQQRHKGERKQRRKNFRKKQGCEFWRSGASDGSGSELANPSGLLWSPSLSGGGIWWVMVWAHRLSENSLCRSMFVCEVESLPPSPAGPPLSQSAGSHLVSPDFHVREPQTGILSSVSWLALVWSGLGEEADSNVPSSLAGC